MRAPHGNPCGQKRVPHVQQNKLNVTFYLIPIAWCLWIYYWCCLNEWKESWLLASFQWHNEKNYLRGFSLEDYWCKSSLANQRTLKFRKGEKKSHTESMEKYKRICHPLTIELCFDLYLFVALVHPLQAKGACKSNDIVLVK